MNLVFSVIIPTYNRRDALNDCLQSLARQEYPRDAFEVIIVDDGGSDPLGDLGARFQGQFVWTRQNKAGPATARNLGALSARGEYLAFTDDDCQPSPDWLRQLERSLSKNPNALIGGRVVNDLPGNSCSAASQELIDYLYASYTKDGSPRLFTSNNIALSRRGFQEVGGFDESFPLAAAEDRDLCARWTRLNRLLVYAPSAVVNHRHALTISKFVRQHYGYGRGAFHFRRRADFQDRERPRLEPVKFYLSLLIYPFKRGSGEGIGRVRTSLLLLLSQAANAAGFFREAITSPSKATHRIP